MHQVHYVLSRNSNRGQGRGFWKELDLADAQSKVNKIPDFIIPVSIDDLPSSDYNIYLHTRHVEQFHPCWSDGLETLLAKLEKHKVPRRKSSVQNQLRIGGGGGSEIRHRASSANRRRTCPRGSQLSICRRNSTSTTATSPTMKNHSPKSIGTGPRYARKRDRHIRSSG